MFHPLQQDLTKFTDSEIENKLQELSKKYFAAQRMGSYELLTQVSTFVTIYRPVSYTHLTLPTKRIV